MWSICNSICNAIDFAFGLNPAGHHYEQDKLRPHFVECLKIEQMTCIFPFKKHTTMQESLRQSIFMYTVTAACHMMVRNGWLSALVARNGITSHVRSLDPKQYLKMIVMIGNVKCAMLGLLS